MFKLESYITPILLSYVDKYIKNFKLEDSQVSLWGGDASFHNLDLRLEVLEQELQLPFSFVSGHIHELLIHVPWTKLASEPITITINTIECILKLRDKENQTSSEAAQSSKEKPRKASGKKVEVETPPGYVQSLINKIVSNIRIYCNNLILKYVEEDIVLSTNVKLLTFESADEKWKPAYTDSFPASVTLRKLITLNDLTICLDKRNAAGKIDVYQEPMLYRCSVTMHLLRVYHSTTANRASTTRLDIYCSSMEFSMTEQQVPMVLRLIALVMALQQREIVSDTDIQVENSSVAVDVTDAPAQESWAGWAWSFVPSILPVTWDEETEKEKEINTSGHIMQIGFYVDDASLTFKVSETSKDRGYYSQKKLKYWPLLSLCLQGAYSEVVAHGNKWLNVTAGISEALLIPVSSCSCSYIETPEDMDPEEYFKSGHSSTMHKSESLFDMEAAENKGQKKIYDTSWDNHMSTVSEASLLERTPAMAFDYLYYIEKPDDSISDKHSDFSSLQSEMDNIHEKSASRIVLGPFKLRLCSGFVHRMSSLKVAASSYDYAPYSTLKVDSVPEVAAAPLPEVDSSFENVPMVTMQVTIFAPIIELQLMDHPYFEPMKGNLFRKKKKVSTSQMSSQQQIHLPKLTFECQCIDFKMQQSLCKVEHIQSICNLPDIPEQVLDRWCSKKSLKVLGFCSRLILTSNRQITVITPSSISCKQSEIVKPHLWLNPDVILEEISFSSESLTITATKAKVMVIIEIFSGFISKAGVDTTTNPLFTSSLLSDASRDCAFPYLELSIEDIYFKQLKTNTTYIIDTSLGSIKVFLFKPIRFSQPTRAGQSTSELTASNTSSTSTHDLFYRTIEQVLIFSGPELKDEVDTQMQHDDFRQDVLLFKATLQFPIDSQNCHHAPLVYFVLQEIQICIDPLLCNWLQYAPKKHYHKADISVDPYSHKNHSISEASGNILETPRRVGAPHESIHSSSDRDQMTQIPRLKKLSDQENDMQDNIFNFLKKWLFIWKGMVVLGDIHHCTLYFPTESLSAEGYQGIQQAVDEAVKKHIAPEIIVLTLPHLCVKSMTQKQNLINCLKSFPVKVPNTIWSKYKSNFPWTISMLEFKCHTLHGGETFDVLKSVSMTATVGISTRPNIEMQSEVDQQPSTSRIEITSIGICVHIDVSPVHICVSDIQICLLASILLGLTDVVKNLGPDTLKSSPKFNEYVSPFVSRQSSSVMMRESTAESVSDRSQSVEFGDLHDADVKLTAWIQWTIAKFTVEILSFNRQSTTSLIPISQESSLKLVFFVEDVVSSLDFQNVYLKIKSKVGSANIQHYVKNGAQEKWKPGPFLGLVMKAKDELGTSEKQEDMSFMSITLTRASCQHTHTLWGAVRRSKLKVVTAGEDAKTSRYITEIVVNVQPVDFVISLATLRNFIAVLDPLVQLTSTSKTSVESNKKEFWMLINNQTVPLLYLESKGLRVIIPSAELSDKNTDLHDFCMFQYDSVQLRPMAVNPICRTPLRPDIYQQAAHARILNIPGSEVEDRQYELNVTGTSISTGLWVELDKFLDISGRSATHLKTMSENPALEWNNLEQGRLRSKSHLSLCPVIRKFDISIVAAPAMVYKKDIIVCGHSMEINFVTDIEMNLSISQIRLAAALANEFSYLLEPFVIDQTIHETPKLFQPYSKFTYSETNFLEETELEVVQDSGFETSDIRSSSPRTVRESIHFISSIHKMSERSAYTFPRTLNPTPFETISAEVLFTGGKVFFILYEQNSTQDRRRYKNKKPHFSWRMDDSETGYEASEEGSLEDYFTGIERYSPLVYLCISQPNAYFYRQQLSRKVQISFFDIDVKISSPENVLCKDIPCADDFNLNFLQTKTGYPDPNTGISPSFFTLKYTKSLGKAPTLDIHIAKPMKVLVSITRWMYLMMIHEKIINSFRYSTDTVKIPYSVITRTSLTTRGSNASLVSEATEIFTKFYEIRSTLHDISSINLRISQVVLVYSTDCNAELNVCLEKFNGSLSICNRPEKITVMACLESVTVSVVKDDFRSLLINPWTVSLEVWLFWEQWQNFDSQPQVYLSAESDCMLLNVSPEHLKIVRIVVREFEEFLSEYSVTDYVSSIHSETNLFLDLDTNAAKDQHYKDDLRAGAFQYLDAPPNSEDLPLPYQVIFWNHNIAAMAWRYPQPRSLTKVRVYPVPFKLTDMTEDLQILCRLEYFSDCHNSFLPYLQFYLSESKINQLGLPEPNPHPIVASVWRVVLTTPSSTHQNLEYDFSKVSASPRALAACMRIDSYFNKNYIPDFTFSLHMSSVQLCLFNHANKHSQQQAPDCLKPFTSDGMFPDLQCFFTLYIENVSSHVKSWNFTYVFLDLEANTEGYILDYKYLTQQSFLMPFKSKLELSSAGNLYVNVISQPIELNFGPSIAHTLAVSVQAWKQSFAGAENSTFVVLSRYVICNDTNVSVRFGQTGTDEDILLLSRHCHMYSWRSQKYKSMLRIGIEQNQWLWSKPFDIDVDGTQMHPLLEDRFVMVVTVKSISNTQKQVVFAGQFILSNMLMEHFEYKIVKAVTEEKEKEFRSTASHIANGKSIPPSLIIDTTKTYFLRLRFFGLESAWSGDIPLMENTKCAQPWLVKVPLQERGQFLSIWCKIVSQNFKEGNKILVMLWPLFMVRSNLPVNSKVRIETPTLNVHLDTTVKGKGEYQQLYCPGTVDHSHQLSFQLAGSTTRSNPYVPLNYSLVDQKQFFKKSDTDDINEILSTLKTYSESHWPYLGEDYEGVDWMTEDQPLTHVQVRYQNVCPYSTCLLVELLPWCLLVNVLGCQICIIINEKELFRVCHNGIVTPPKLEETFHIGVSLDDSWNMSPPLQLAKSNWGQTFYMPKIAGTIPEEGTIVTVVRCNSYVCMVAITSSISNEIRLLKISSTHVFTNYLQIPIKVACFAVPETDALHDIPSIINNYCLSVPPKSPNGTGVSLLKWFLLDDDSDTTADYNLYISFCTSNQLGWSCPVKINKTCLRKSIVIVEKHRNLPVCLTCEEYKGQTYLALHEDLYPQLLIKNFSGTKLYCGQYSEDTNEMVTFDSQHFRWTCSIDNNSTMYYTMPSLSEKFPDVSTNGQPSRLCFAGVPRGVGRDLQWSTPVNITTYNFQYIRIPSYGDVRVSIFDSGNTILLVLESVTEAEIHAKDIRLRLNVQSELKKKSELDVLSVSSPRLLEIAGPSAGRCSDTTIASSYLSAEESMKTAPSELRSTTSSNYDLELHKKSPELDNTTESSSVLNPFNLPKRPSALKFIVFIESITISLTSDLEKVDTYHSEIINITLDDIAVTAMENEVFEIYFTSSDVQFDNQMFNQGQFDFPVVLINQDKKQVEKYNALTANIETLVEHSRNNAGIALKANLECRKDIKTGYDLRDLYLQICPLSIYIEDCYVTILVDYLKTFTPTSLVVWSMPIKAREDHIQSTYVKLPRVVVWESQVCAKPLHLRNLYIEPISLLLSVHSTIKMYIALDKSPLQFGQFERKHLLTTPYRLGHALTYHYLTGAIFGAGWVVGSLELLGSPGGLARAMGSGIRDFVSLPYHGLFQGPWAFLRGVTHGSASLMKHLTAGTLQSVTKLASSVARNLDRLTLDEEHLRRAEEQRRQRPQGVTQGFVQGLTGLGISLLGAVGGIAHHPLQSVMSDGASPRSLAAGVGLGIVGMFTKPLSGAAELVALTGQGLLQGAGWNPLPEPRKHPIMNHSNPNSMVKYRWKFNYQIKDDVFFVTEATYFTTDSEYEAVALILTSESLIVVNIEDDVIVRMIGLSDLFISDGAGIPTMLSFRIRAPVIPPPAKSEDEGPVQMDPACRARVADFVRSTNSILLLSDDISMDHSEASGSPVRTPDVLSTTGNSEEVLSFYVNQQARNYFLGLFVLVKQQSDTCCFSIL